MDARANFLVVASADASRDPPAAPWPERKWKKRSACSSVARSHNYMIYLDDLFRMRAAGNARLNRVPFTIGDFG